jgi:hypothetical protein
MMKADIEASCEIISGAGKLKGICHFSPESQIFTRE